MRHFSIYRVKLYIGGLAPETDEGEGCFAFRPEPFFFSEPFFCPFLQLPSCRSLRSWGMSYHV